MVGTLLKGNLPCAFKYGALSDPYLLLQTGKLLQDLSLVMAWMKWQ